MEEDQNSLNQEADSGDVVDDVIEAHGDAEQVDAEQGHADKDDPYGVKKRLGMQAKKHQREMRQMQEQMQHIQSQMQRPDQQSQSQSQGQPDMANMSEQEKIQMAVRYALGAKDHEEQQAKEADRHAHVQKQYQRLNNEFDRASDKYDDFDDVVRGNDVPFTPHVRDALLLVDNPSEVAYRLGKNRDDLERISKLHPLDQAREVNKLSFALMGGNNGKPSNAQGRSEPMGSTRVNPASASNAVTDKTPPSAIRARMKAGTWK